MLYAAALDREPDFLPAAANLAAMEIRSGMYSTAVDRLQRLLARLATDEEAQKDWPGLKYMARYNLALALRYLSRARP